MLGRFLLTSSTNCGMSVGSILYNLKLQGGLTHGTFINR